MCGLFGFISSKGDVKINKQNFNTLGVYNDARGGDSVGILVNEEVEYGINDTKLFSKFYKGSNLLTPELHASFILGHTRKASVGKVSLENAQPVVIYDEEGKDVEFVLFHNGTLKNHLALAGKYLTPPFDGVTDSYIMAYLLYFEGFKIFKEYIGAGMFITVDYRKNRKSPTISFFKGASTVTELTTPVFEERPLYVYENEEGFWYSSMENSLELISSNDPAAKIKNLPCNTVFSYVNGKLIKKESISRAAAMQGTAYGLDNVLLEHYKSYSIPKNNFPVHREENFVENPKQSNLGKACYHLPSRTHLYTQDKISFEDGLYYLNGKLLHGVKKFTDYGFTFDVCTDMMDYYFYQGVLLYGKNIYEALCMIEHEFTITAKDLIQYHSYMVYWKSPMPVEDENGFFYTVTNKFEYEEKKGLYYPLLTSPCNCYFFDQGILEKVFDLSYGQKMSYISSFKDICDATNKITSEEYYQILIENISPNEITINK